MDLHLILLLQYGVIFDGEMGDRTFRDEWFLDCKMDGYTIMNPALIITYFLLEPAWKIMTF